MSVGYVGRSLRLRVRGEQQAAVPFAWLEEAFDSFQNTAASAPPSPALSSSSLKSLLLLKRTRDEMTGAALEEAAQGVKKTGLMLFMKKATPEEHAAQMKGATESSRAINAERVEQQAATAERLRAIARELATERQQRKRKRDKEKEISKGERSLCFFQDSGCLFPSGY